MFESDLPREPERFLQPRPIVFFNETRGGSSLDPRERAFLVSSEANGVQASQATDERDAPVLHVETSRVLALGFDHPVAEETRGWSLIDGARSSCGLRSKFMFSVK